MKQEAEFDSCLEGVGFLGCEVFTWVTCQPDAAGALPVPAAGPRHAAFCVCHLASVPLP